MALYDDQSRRNRTFAQELLRQGMDPSPVQHPLQAVARALMGATGGYLDRQDREQDREAWSNLLNTYPGMQPAAPMQQPSALPSTSAPSPVAGGTAAVGAVTTPTPTNRPEVMPSAKVWGDKEAEAAGLYEPTRSSSTPIPANVQAYIKAAGANPATRQLAVQMLQQYGKPRETWNTIRGDDGSIYQRNALTGELKAIEKSDVLPEAAVAQKERIAKAGKQEINIGGGSDKQVFDTVVDRADKARAAAAGLQGLREARTALQGGAITGFGANQQLDAQKFLAKAFGADDSKIVNTETFRAAIAPQVSAVLKATVGTANISNTDREFAEKAAGGSIVLDAKSISRLLDIMERASVAQIDSHNSTVRKVYPDGERFFRERALFEVEMPQAPAVAPIAPAPSPAPAPIRQQGAIPTPAEAAAELARRRGQVR